MVEYQELSLAQMNQALFDNFIRYQKVTNCWRKEEGQWVIKEDPFIDDWSDDDYHILVTCLKQTINQGGFVGGAFYQGKLKGFVSVEAKLFSEENYLDLSSLHVSSDIRGKGIGKKLFEMAKQWAKKQGADKLYISSHSAVETQAFYKAMGCKEARIYNQEHVLNEPFDCQLECKL